PARNPAAYPESRPPAARGARLLYAIAVATGRARSSSVTSQASSDPPPREADPTSQRITCWLKWDHVVRFGYRIHHIGASWAAPGLVLLNSLVEGTWTGIGGWQWLLVCSS